MEFDGTEPEKAAMDPDFAVLSGGDVDKNYFRQVNRACAMLLKWHAHRSDSVGAENPHDMFESAHMRDMLDRFQYTLEVLQMKHAYSPVDDRVRLDLTDSGWPNRQEVITTQLDLLSREKILREMPSEQTLKAEALDVLFKEKKEPTELLGSLANRRYLEMLDETKLFLPFVAGPLVEWKAGDGKNTRGFITGWGCYGAEKNAPYTYSMHFEQDSSRPSLLTKKGQEDLAELSAIIREEGSRVPSLLVLAAQIDEQLEPIHPKFIKRTRIGPLYTRLLLEQRAPEALDEMEKTLLQLFRSFGEEDDFVLMCSEEIIFSYSEYQGKRFLIPTKMLQLFYVPPRDRELYETGVSRLYHYALMPHRILQNLSQDDVDKLPKLARCMKIGYDKQERLYEVS